MKLFLSTYSFKIDKKGRISLPAPYRSIISNKKSPEIILFKSFKYKTIEGCDHSRIENISKRINQLDIFSDEQDDFMTSIFSELKSVKLDSEGRFIVPDDLLNYAKIKNEATFIGLGHSFQLCSPDFAKKRQSESRHNNLKNKRTLRSIIIKDVDEY
tara:strand:+ start:880 stop:1350 length:471 start_codon:yes stop_codon:yes gene_type:complete